MFFNQNDLFAGQIFRTMKYTSGKQTIPNHFTVTFIGARKDSSVSSARSFHSFSVRTSFLLHAEPK